ncbi:hypothetical protein D917_00030 [Trichinella nativa]|uniref:Uncharacterized protein n=1 Tax=Trichinella nativa TaxID=6335 RepID=A0A1Y3EFQ1_9BILA|nr:hypothetical protein D917_00030 [Trichinella nativa]
MPSAVDRKASTNAVYNFRYAYRRSYGSVAILFSLHTLFINLNRLLQCQLEQMANVNIRCIILAYGDESDLDQNINRLCQGLSWTTLSEKLVRRKMSS